MLVSIIIPVYNAANTIRACLQSVTIQTFADFEVILLDGLSTDETASIVTVYSRNDQRIKCYSEKDNGIYDAMNKGMALAKGEWIYFMGSDDVLHSSTVLETFVQYFTSSYDLVYGDVRWVPENRIEQGEWNHRQLLQTNINHQRIFYRKSLFERYGGYELQYKVAADHALNIRLFCNAAVRKKYVPLVVADYHSGGFSANRIDEVFWNHWDTTVLQHFKGLVPTKEIYSTLNSYYRYLLQQKKYKKAFAVAWKIMVQTKSVGFVWLAIKQFVQALKLME